MTVMVEAKSDPNIHKNSSVAFTLLTNAGSETEAG